MLPSIIVSFGTVLLRCLVDTGCTTSILTAKFASAHGLRVSNSHNVVAMLNGQSADVIGTYLINLLIAECPIELECFVISDDLFTTKYDMILGCDMVQRMGGIVVSPLLEVSFPARKLCFSNSVAVGALTQKPTIVDSDFEAFFMTVGLFDGNGNLLPHRW